MWDGSGSKTRSRSTTAWLKNGCEVGNPQWTRDTGEFEVRIGGEAKGLPVLSHGLAVESHGYRAQSSGQRTLDVFGIGASCLTRNASGAGQSSEGVRYRMRLFIIER